ncbi:MAG: tetratricopeptide repeat protein [Anaerolineae bacterium]|nr:tetratricopeptide repeat protein [Anaerolineae bacterium]
MSEYRLEDGLFWQFRDLVQTASGLYFPDKKRTELETAVHKALQSAPHGITDPATYCRHLRLEATSHVRSEMTRLLNLLTVGETHFFRDSAQFNALAQHILPALINRKREAAAAMGQGTPPQLRLWSAGCATGEEAYSLAILLHELIPDIAQWRILILATDLNENYLAQARQATYYDWSFREERAQQLRSRYFQPARQNGRDGYQLQDQVRRLVTFAPHNLAADDFPGTVTNTVYMDLILCRNVSIYFAPETTRQVVQRFHQALVADGWLVVGHAEPSLATYSAFTGHIVNGTLLYQKTKGGTAVPPPRPQFTLPAIQPTPPTAVSSTDPYEEAGQLISHGRIEAAISLLEKAVTTQSPQAATLCLLARAYADLGQWPQARRWCEQARVVDPLLPEVYDVLAMIETHEGRPEAAIHNLKKVLYLDPARPLAHFHLALLYKKQSQVVMAQRALKNVLHRMESVPAESILPDSDHTSAGRLTAVAQRLLEEMG